MPNASHSTDRSPYVVDRLYQLGHATAVAADKPNLADHADAEREAAEEIKRLRRWIEGLEMRLSMLQGLAKVSFVTDRDFSADPVDESDSQNLRQLLKSSDVADMFDRAAERRIAELIGRARFDPKKN
jgi:hypothetical protein